MRPHLKGLFCDLQIVNPANQDNRRVGMITSDLMNQHQP
jgi:hypothetical protein